MPEHDESDVMTLSFRCPIKIVAQLDEVAKAERRSRSGQIVYLIEKGLAEKGITFDEGEVSDG